MRREYIIGLLIGAVIFSILLAGCEENQESSNEIPSNQVKIEVKTGGDDGGVVALTDLLPETVFGVLNGGSDQPFMVGLFTSGGGDNLTGRAIYRFDISGYENKGFIFHVKCVDKSGNPGDLEVYLINDSGSLPSTSSEMSDVSEVWNLVERGEKITTVAPSSGQWITVDIPSSAIESKVTESGYITIMLKLKNEDLSSNMDYYSLSTYEYLQGSAKPYLSIPGAF
ncbi:MAG: hypothetical protein DRN12_04545 [Thermoplasmata archaeon]|nr:MAG: hypothetical protein DRN12_04545 [Thermoplasmata archaeon]